MTEAQLTAKPEKTEGLFETPAQFSLHIEQLAASNKLSYVDTVLAYCEQNSLDFTEVAKFINKPLRDKLENDFREMSMLPKIATLGFEFDMEEDERDVYDVDALEPTESNFG